MKNNKTKPTELTLDINISTDAIEMTPESLKHLIRQTNNGHKLLAFSVDSGEIVLLYENDIKYEIKTTVTIQRKNGKSRILGYIIGDCYIPYDMLLDCLNELSKDAYEESLIKERDNSILNRFTKK